MCVSERPPPLCGITVRGTVSPAGRFPHGPRHRAWPLTARAVATLSPQRRGDRPPPTGYIPALPALTPGDPIHNTCPRDPPPEGGAQVCGGVAGWGQHDSAERGHQPWAVLGGGRDLGLLKPR